MSSPNRDDFQSSGLMCMVVSAFFKVCLELQSLYQWLSKLKQNVTFQTNYNFASLHVSSVGNRSNQRIGWKIQRVASKVVLMICWVNL